MRTHTGRRPLLRRAALVSCAATVSCVILAACAATPKGPDTEVTAPAVGRPPAPASAQAALSSEAFTPYAGLGAVANDGLAPGDTYDALHTACMNDAGYGQYAAQAPYSIRTNSGFTFALPYGWQGYIGTALAAQQGFLAGTPLAPGGGGWQAAQASPARRSPVCPPGRKRPRASASTSWRTSITPSSPTPWPSSRRSTTTSATPRSRTARSRRRWPTGRPAWPRTGTAPPMRTRSPSRQR